MGDFTGRTPGDTFGGMLVIDNSNNGIDGTIRPVQDAKGTAAPFSLSTATFQLNAGAAFTAGAGATMDFGNITVSNLATWTKLAEISPTSGSSFQVTGIPATAVAVMIVFSDMDYSTSSRIRLNVMDDSVVQSAGYESTSIFYDNSATPSGAVSTSALHIVRMNNTDGDSTQSGTGVLTKNGTTGKWSWVCNGRNDNTVTPGQISSAHVIGSTPLIAGVMNGIEIEVFSGTYVLGTLTISYQEEG